MIPQEKSAAVARALSEAFGVTEVEYIRQMTKGLTASLVFRIVVRGSAYLLKINIRLYQVDMMTRQFACMRAADEAGLAPHVRYTSVEDQISITDFVEAVPFPETDARARMPGLLRRLHALPPFGGAPHHLNTSCMFLLNQGPALEGFLQRFQGANLMPKGESEEAFARYAEIAAVYPHHDPDFVSSHNDLKPENVLFDGQRAWLVDWEAAFRNDRYVDLAVLAHFLVTNDAEEKVYLGEYFGQPADEEQLARFFLMRQVSHLFFAMAYLLAGKAVELSGQAPDFREFHRQNWAGEIDLESAERKVGYGRAHWGEFLRKSREGRFEESLRVVADRHGRS